MSILKQKLTSRKFWAALAAAVGAVVIALFGEELGGTAMNALSSAVKVLIAYICGETAIDVSRIFLAAFVSGGDSADAAPPEDQDQP